MGVKHNKAQQRKDRFYRLAKDTGYRARSAFKLIQLNRRYEFLQSARVLVDLCAAPGSWLQVASQNMPVASTCIGVDLVPIKPVPHCLTFQADITHGECRQRLLNQLSGARADVVLHDGAPNLGQNWDQDAFKQAELTLAALALATAVLRKGGWFVSKLFRSKDYHALIWVLKSLFARVDATKPQASRNESAEIFVVCQKYLAPDRIDPKFLNPKFVFGEMDDEMLLNSGAVSGRLSRVAKKPKAIGYSEGDLSVYRVVPITQFIESDSPKEILQTASKLQFDSQKLKNHKLTTQEVVQCCEDLKVLGKADIKLMLKWRKQLREQYGLDKPAPDNADVGSENDGGPVTLSERSADTEDVDEDSRDLRDLSRLESEIKQVDGDLKSASRKRTAREQKQRLRVLSQLQSIGCGSETRMADEDLELFRMRDVFDSRTSSGDMDFELDVDCVPVLDDRNNDVTVSEAAPFVKFSRDTHQVHRDVYGNFDRTVAEHRDDEHISWVDTEKYSDFPASAHGLGLANDDDGMLCAAGGDDQEVDRLKSMSDQTLMVEDFQLAAGRKLTASERKAKNAELWFQKESFAWMNDASMNDEQAELDNLPSSRLAVQQESMTASAIVDTTRSRSKVTQSSSADTALDRQFRPQRKQKDVVNETAGADNLNSIGDFDQHDKVHEEDEVVLGQGVETNARLRKLSADEFTLGSMLVHSRKSRRDLLDDAYNRYTFHETDLPRWFVDDERKHMRRAVQLDPELLRAHRERLRDVDVRPIKKVAEAKARKKRQLQKRLERARKRAEGVLSRPDTSTAEKVSDIKRLYARAQGRKKQEVQYVVSRKRSLGKRVRRPNGVKGPFRVVDPRMKKDKRLNKGGKSRSNTKGKRASSSKRRK